MPVPAPEMYRPSNQKGFLFQKLSDPSDYKWQNPIRVTSPQLRIPKQSFTPS